MSSASPAPVLEQHPAPHDRKVRHVGDTLRITLTLNRPCCGAAFVRTNLGNGEIQRQEIVREVEMGQAPLGRDWRDLPMRQTGGARYEVRLPLVEVGVFSYMCFFLEESTGEVFWPRGENASVKVVSELCAAGNTIYNAFVRQFGENISGKAATGDLQKASQALDQANYTVIPPSGTFRALQSKLDFILGQMGFRILQFLPVHPVPTTFARMGRFGSPFAPLDFYDVDASMAEFDQRTTPLGQFLQLVDQVHARGAMVFLDLPIDHTGWASVLQSHHPEWFARNPDGSFQSPGAWGVVWADLCKLDFSRKELWIRLAEIFLHWCRNGVDGFRCDAGYMVPVPVWRYIVAKVRQQFPDTVFFLEGLGGGQDATTRLLEDADLDWAYSELFQNHGAQEMGRYLEFSSSYSASYGALVHFAETHDNDRLAARSKEWARLRVALCALFSPAGCFGIANGVEWYATEKIDVHGARSLNWGAPDNMVPLLSSLNALMKSHPAFRADARLRVPYGSGGSAVGLLREPRGDRDHAVLVVANPKADEATEYQWHFQEFDPGSRPVDLLSGRAIPAVREECLYRVPVKAGQVLCLCYPGRQTLPKQPYDALARQQLLATVLRLRVSLNGMGDQESLPLEDQAYALFQNPAKFFADLAGETRNYVPMVEWAPETDGRRDIVVPVDHYLLVRHDTPFQGQVDMSGVVRCKFHSIPMADGRHFAFLTPLERRITHPVVANLHLVAYGDAGYVRRFDVRAQVFPESAQVNVLRRIAQKNLTNRHCALAANSRGSYGLVRGMWGNLEGQYDALLAANQNPAVPSDRTTVLSRVRAWLIYHDYAQEISVKCQTDFAVPGRNAASWHFVVPSGMGGNAYLAVRYELDPEENRGRLIFTRCPLPEDLELPALDANAPVTLILKPDVDDCCNHNPTLAYQGAERSFPRRITPFENGFAFALESGNRLETRASRGVFLNDGEWSYNLHNAMEAERGLRANHDLYCPGHFRLQLKRGESAVLEFAVLEPKKPAMAAPAEPGQGLSFHEPGVQQPLDKVLLEAMDAFVVRRGSRKTVIAGYPWFLDWGRDTLICIRGLLAAGRIQDCRDILQEFATYEERGTLPNMIAGANVSNRDTVDASLWFVVALREYAHWAGRDALAELLALPCGRRTMLQVVESIAEFYQKGTPNGICMDADSGLVFSPSHFTWMDTNFPAGTPRQGYPIEIQALWYQTLCFLAETTGEESYATLAEKVHASVNELYPSRDNVGLSDCLHANPGTPAAKAVKDDACRPNQLFALAAPGLITDPELRKTSLAAAGHLLTPGAIRTLADQRVEVLLPIYKDGTLLNNPSYPYWGEYKGDEDTRRKPAYHNGTAWPWVMPSFCEALLQTYGKAAVPAVQALLQGTGLLLRRGCLGHLPEILDGDSPHENRGCCAQAWSVTEAYRLVKILEEYGK